MTSEDTTKPVRFHMPDERPSITKKFVIKSNDEEIDGYVTVGLYKTEDGIQKIGEIFIMTAKEGDSTRGLLNTLSIAVSVGLQHGVPMQKYIDKFKCLSFPPSGMTQDKPPLTFAQSVVDYVFRWIEHRFFRCPDEEE